MIRRTVPRPRPEGKTYFPTIALPLSFVTFTQFPNDGLNTVNNPGEGLPHALNGRRIGCCRLLPDSKPGAAASKPFASLSAHATPADTPTNAAAATVTPTNLLHVPIDALPSHDRPLTRAEPHPTMRTTKTTIGTDTPTSHPTGPTPTPNPNSRPHPLPQRNPTPPTPLDPA